MNAIKARNLLKLIIKEALLHVGDEEKLGAVSTKTDVPTLRVFDFDDTLVKTNSQVGITEFDKATGEQVGEKYFITPAQYAKFKTEVASQHPELRYDYDYAQFAQVVDPKIIEFTFRILKNVVKKMREDTGAPAVILTARGVRAQANIREFLKAHNISIPVITLDGSAPELKSGWIKNAMIERNIPHVEFFDDSKLNVDAVAALSTDPELLNRFGDKLRIRSRLIQASS